MYSLLDGLASPLELATRAKELKQPAVAISDHGNMYGTIDFFTTCKDIGIKPIIGLEAYVAIDKRTDKNYKKGEIVYDHITLLAKDQKGYKNLIRLSTIGYCEGFYYRPRIDLETLFAYKEGIIVLSGCMFSRLSRLAIEGKIPQCVSLVQLFQKEFGEDYYIEMQDFGIPDQNILRDIIPQLATDMKIKVVATNDIHYIYKTDSTAHEALLCIGTGTHIKDPKRMRFPSSELYMKSYDEMNTLWPFEYLDNTMEVADKCKVEIELNRKMHIYEPKSSFELLKTLVIKEFKRRKFMPEEVYWNRLGKELIAIERTEYAEYIMVVADFVRFAKNKGIPIGSGRGSSAGSLVCYLLDITDIDPLKYGLLFERFINTERIEPPDIDVDVCQTRRKEILDYLKDKYGKNRVAQITTFGSMKTRAVIRDVCRVLQLPFSLGDIISKKLGEHWEGTVVDAFNRPDVYSAIEEVIPTTQITELFDITIKIENKLRHSSTHAAGIVISDKDLIEITPLCTRVGSDDILTQYDMNSIAKLGLLKFDILGLRTLTVIHNACKMAGIHHKDIPLDDSYIYRQLNNGCTIGVFQYEGYGYTRFIKQMKPKKFNDLIALGSLYRPGPLNSGMADDYVKRMHGEDYINEFPGISDDTYGILLYQEQIMELAVQYAGFSMNKADILRKAIGKKDDELMKSILIEFKEGLRINGIAKNAIDSITQKIITFARYGWNKAHAVSYALLSYQTAWLRFNQPISFWCALLTSELDDTKRMPILMHEATVIDGVKIEPPHINISNIHFSLYNKELYAGLLAIKGIGEKVCGAILSERNDRGPFKDTDDLRHRIPPKSLNKRMLELLVNAEVFRETPQLSEFDKFQLEEAKLATFRKC